MEYKTNLKWNIRSWACKPCFTVIQFREFFSYFNLKSYTLHLKIFSVFESAFKYF